MPDVHKNFAVSLVAVAPVTATAGTALTVTTGEGTKFPTAPFNATIWPAGANPTTANAEIVRVTAVVSDVLTIVRAQESSSARTVVVGDQIAATITTKTLTDIEADVALKAPIDRPGFTGLISVPVIAGDASSPADGDIWYNSTTSKFRKKENGVISDLGTDQYLATLTSGYTMGTGTGLQKAFNGTTNGAVTLLGSTAYYFNGFYRMTALSSNANMGMGFGGSATITSMLWWTFGVKGTTGNAVTTGLNSSMNTAASNALVVTGTSSTNGYVNFWGKVRINAGGTFIPQFSQNIGGAAVMEPDSSFIIWPAGAGSIVTLGPWS